MFTRRMAQAVLFAALLAAVAAGLPREAKAHSWNTVTVDATGIMGYYGTSIVVDAMGNPMISYYDETNEDLKFAMCDLSSSANGSCDQGGDWSLVTVDANGDVGWTASIAVDADGDPVISYWDKTNNDLKYAICDLSASANGNCDQAVDWSLATVDADGDVGWTASIAVDADGDPVISYYDATNKDLKFAICDLSASANGNCDQAVDWSLATVDADGDVGSDTSIAVDANGDPVISYWDQTNNDLKFAMCDLSGSVNGNCDQGGDWSLATVDAEGYVGRSTSIVVDAMGNPMISYWDQINGDLKFAMCDLSGSANGNCDQAADWSAGTVDGEGAVGFWTSITVDANGDPVISYGDQTNRDLKFAVCDLSGSANGNCDQGGDWSVETVDAVGDVGRFTSIAVDANGDSMISYHDLTNGGLKFAIGSPAPPPTPTPTPTPTSTPVPTGAATVGGVARYPDAATLAGGSGSSAGRYALLAALVAVAAGTLTVGAWYARRRWLR